MKKAYISSSLILALISFNAVQAKSLLKHITENVGEQFQEIIEKYKIEKQEFKPIIFDNEESNGSLGNEDFDIDSATDTNPKHRNLSFKNEFFQSIKV